MKNINPTPFEIISMDLSEEYKNYLREVILILVENIQDLKQKHNIADEEEKEYIAGRLYSYHEVIYSLQTVLKSYGITEQEIGLDQISI